MSLETTSFIWPTACVCVIGVPERESGYREYGKIFEGVMAGKCTIVEYCESTDPKKLSKPQA